MTVSLSSLGPRLVYKGNWQAGRLYHRTDVVYSAGSSWLSLVGANLANNPMMSPGQWGMLARRGDQGPTGATGATGPQGPQGPQSRAYQEIPGSRPPRAPGSPGYPSALRSSRTPQPQCHHDSQ